MKLIEYCDSFLPGKRLRMKQGGIKGVLLYFERERETERDRERETERERDRERQRERDRERQRDSSFVGALSLGSHKGLHQG